jgi:hypothetical protein
MTPWSLIDIYQYFGGTYCLHLQFSSLKTTVLNLKEVRMKWLYFIAQDKFVLVGLQPFTNGVKKMIVSKFGN